MGRIFSISHLLFVDDILIFGLGSPMEWHAYHSMIMELCDVSDLSINKSKSSLLEYDASLAALFEIRNLF